MEKMDKETTKQVKKIGWIDYLFAILSPFLFMLVLFYAFSALIFNWTMDTTSAQNGRFIVGLLIGIPVFAIFVWLAHAYVEGIKDRLKK